MRMFRSWLYALCLCLTFWPTLSLAEAETSAPSEPRMPWPVVPDPSTTPPDSGTAAKHTDVGIITGAIDPAPAPIVGTISQIITRDPMGPTDEDVADDTALKEFYKAADGKLLWVEDIGLTPAAYALISELNNAEAWGLRANAFQIPSAETLKPPFDADTKAALEVQLSRAALLYARHARGGRIMAPSEVLNSHLNRTPQLLDPNDVMQGLAEAKDIGQYLTSLHPRHTQFQRLRQAYLSQRKPRQRIRLKATEILERGAEDKRVPALRQRLGLRAPIDANDAQRFDEALETAVRQFQEHAGIVPADGSVDFDTARALNKRANMNATKLQANMEMWRWMWDDLGDTHVMANVPAFMLWYKKNGETLYRERAVVGQVSKQTSIFTRTLKHIVLRPMWRVPESIKVRELWPSLKRGGGLMRQYGLKLETKDGKPVNWRRINWHKNDIRSYEVVQPPGRGSVMGKVKFSFPSQHTIFIHDTPDKYMFRSRRRTFSHGCLRLRNPVKLARLLLQEDKGWDAAKVDDMIATGPNRNAIKIESRIPIHLVYFTAWVDDDGKLKSYSDIYGHEKRVRQALAGQWKRIAKGRNHLAPPQPIVSSRRSRARRAARARKQGPRSSDYITRALNGVFY